jgi:predicted NAD-dependent protein-ADP-ribosyltransferase YbiA (DUF1768 family)
MRDYSFLSNSSKSEIYLADRLYPSVEHFYQAGKAKTAVDHEYIRTAITPAEAVLRGNEVEKREDWDEIKNSYMKLGLVLKFDINELGNLLLDTEDKYLDKILMQVRDQVIERRSKQVSYIGNQEV